MAFQVGELFAKLGLRDNDFNQGIDKAGSKWSSFGAGLVKIGAGAAIGVGAAMGKLAVEGVQSFSTLQSGMNEVFTLLPDISDQAMSDMTQQVRDFSKEFGTLPDQTVPALYQALSAGVPQGNVFEFLETAQKAATGGVTELETAVDGISSVVNAYGSDVIDAGKASDLMFTAVRLGKTNFEELSASLFNVLPTASALGVGFEDVTAAMATMTAQGTPTSVATTQMRQLLVELSKDGSKAAEMFEQMAGKSFQQFMSEGGNMREALDMMSAAANNNDMALQDMFGSVEAGAAALSLTGGRKFQENLDEMADSAGATEAAYDQMDQGLSRSWDKIKATINDAVIEVGQRLEPFVQMAADWLGEKIPQAIEWMMGAWDSMSAAIGPILDAARNLISGFGDSTEGTFSSISALIAAFQTGFETVRTIVSDVIAAVADILDAHGDKIDAIVERVGAALGDVAALFQAIFGAIGEFWANWGDEIMAVASTVFGAITTIIGTALGVVRSIIQTITAVISGDWDAAWEGVKNILSGVWELITTIVSEALGLLDQLIGDGIDAAVEWFKDLPGRILDAIGDLGSLLLDVGRSVVQGFIDGVTGMFGSVRQKFNDLTSFLPDWKGPAATDRRILEPAGRMVMEGFERGLERQFPQIRSTLNGVADLVDTAAFDRMGATAMMRAGSTAAAAAATQVGSVDRSQHITINHPNTVDLAGDLAIAGQQSRLAWAIEGGAGLP